MTKMQASRIHSDEYDNYENDRQANDEYTSSENTYKVGESFAVSLERVDNDEHDENDGVENITVLASKTEPTESTESEENREIDEETLLTNMKPGERLCHLRKQKKLSIQHVADRLYLDTGVINALEEDNYDRLPSAIFVRGYLRNYAKLLEISPDPLLEAYNSFDHAKSKSPIIKPQTKSKQQATSGDWWVKGIGFILLIALMVLMAQSGINYFNNHSAGQLPVQEDNDNANINGEVVNNNTALVVGEPRENGEAAVYTPPTEEEAAVANNNSEEETSESQETPTSTTTAVETTTVAETTATSESTTTTEAETTTAEIEADKVDLRKMLLHYSKASWTRVTDKTNKSVYEGIPKDGDVITVQGEPPFKVRLGVLSHVMIEYNNKKISADEYPERSGRNVIVGEALSQENASH